MDPSKIVSSMDALEAFAARLDEVQAFLARLIATAGPIQRQEAYQQTAAHFGIILPERTAERVLIKAASNLVRTKQIRVEGGEVFCWDAPAP